MKKLFAILLAPILCFTCIPYDSINADIATGISAAIPTEFEFAKLQNGAEKANSFDNSKLFDDPSVKVFNELTEDSFSNGTIIQGVFTINNKCELPKSLVGKDIDLSAAYFTGDGELTISGGAAIKGYCGSLKVVVDSTEVVRFADSKFEGDVTPKTTTKFYNSIFDKSIDIEADYSSLENCSTGDVKAGGKNIFISCANISGNLEIDAGYNCSVVENYVNGDISIIGGNFISIAECELASSQPINAISTYNLLINNNKSNSKPIVKHNVQCSKIYGNDIEVSKNEAAGANEELLPQRDNSRFSGMERFENVTVENKEMPIKDYLLNSYSEGKTVIVPPGVYSISKGKSEHILFENLNKYQILAYGVEFIFEDYGQTGMFMQNCDTVRIKGLTVDHKEVSNTQGTVLKKKEGYDGYLEVKIDDGYPSDQLDQAGSCSIEVYKPKYDYSYARTWFSSVKKIRDRVYRLSGSNKTVGEVGDKFILTGRSAHVFWSNESSSINYEDVTVYDGSAFAFFESNGNKATVLNRVAITPGPKPAGATEERLKSTRDATHGTSMREGMKVNNSVFEKMTDDGANMCGNYGEIKKFNKDTKTITYKNNSTIYGSNTADFSKADRAWIYTYDGKFLCDAKATSDTKNGTVKIDKTFKMPLDGTIVLIENASRSGNGFVYDNCLIQKQMPRGMIIKASNGIIRNCTIADSGKSGILIYPEIYDGWGECGFSTDVTIENNLIINCGYYDYLKYDGSYADRTVFTPIAVMVDADPTNDPSYQNQKNIKILNNVIKSRNTTYAVYISGANNVEIKGNDFGIRAKSRFGKAQNSLASKNDDTATSVCIKGSTNVTVKDNVYPKSAKVKVLVDKLSKNVKVS